MLRRNDVQTIAEKTVRAGEVTHGEERGYDQARTRSAETCRTAPCNALLRTATAVDRLRNMGIEVQIIGSLAEGRFQAHSDVDFLIERLADPSQRYTLESVVEDVLQDIPSDVVYADEVRWSDR